MADVVTNILKVFNDGKKSERRLIKSNTEYQKALQMLKLSRKERKKAERQQSYLNLT